MEVDIYLKGGQTITLTHVEKLMTQRAYDGTLTNFEWITKDLPDKKVKLHSITLDHISAIATRDR